jgi:hypothetical protein
MIHPILSPSTAQPTYTLEPRETLADFIAIAAVNAAPGLRARRVRPAL